MVISQEHILQLMLGPEMRSALIKYQAKHDLSPNYAALQCLAKQLYNEGYLDKGNYEILILKYGRKLVPERAVKLTFEQLKEKQKLDEKARTFSMVLDQWNIQHKPGWKEDWLRQAEKYKDQIPAARMLLDLGADQK